MIARKLILLISGLFFIHAISLAQPTLSGTVRNAATSGPVASADLDVYDSVGNRITVTGALTAADGTYTISLPGPGSYIVRVDMATGAPLADQYYPGVFLRSQATPIDVPLDTSQITGIDFSLQSGYFISGRVTGNGTNPGILDLDLYAANGEFLGGYPASTAAGGTFSIGALPSGSYYLKADPDPALGQYLVQAYYGDSLQIAGATPISLNNGSANNINWDLASGGAIGGIIRSEAGVVLEGIDLDVWDSAGNRLPYTGRSQIDGTYLVGPMPAGTYTLRADPDATQGHVRTYYGNGLNRDLAVPISVSDGSVTPNIDFSLPPGGTISGTITGPAGTPLSGIDFDLFDATGARVSLTTTSDMNGQFLIGALPSGTYTVRADPAFNSGYAGAYFGGNSARSSAVPINVTAGADSPGINFQLQAGGWIEGTIRDAGSTVVAGIDLDIFDASGTRLYPTARTGLDGRYAIGPLPMGPVVLRADPSETQGVAEIYHPDANDFIDAVPVTISSGSATPGIDFALPFAGWITGFVRDLSGAPLQGIDLDVFDAVGNRISLNAVTQTDGSYTIGPVPVGQVTLRADPVEMQGYARRYYPDARLSTSAGIVEVVRGTETSGINMALPPAGWISGSVRDNFGTGIAGVDLILYNGLTDARLLRSDVSSADGSFLVGPLEYGTYHLQASPISGAPFAMEYFQESAELGTATPIGINSQNGNTGIDFTLSAGKSVSGTVTLPDGQPAVGIDMDILEAGTGVRLEQNSVTDSAGQYTFPQVPYGSYIVRADPLDTTSYLDTYYIRTALESAATAIDVSDISNTDAINIQLLEYVTPTFSLNGTGDSFVVMNESSGPTLFDLNAPSGAVQSMRFYVNGQLVFTDTTEPFGFSTSDLPIGIYALVPVVVDVFGRETTGDTIAIINPAQAPTLSKPIYTVVPDGSGRILLAWQSVLGATYRIESSDDLQSPWTALETVTGTGEILNHLEATPSGKSRFLRIVVEN